MDETKQETPAQEMATLLLDDSERRVLYAIHQEIPLGRRAVPVLRSLKDGGPLALDMPTARSLRDLMTGILDGGGIKGGLLEVAEIERKLIELAGEAEPRPPQAPPTRQQKRAAQRRVRR